MERIKSILVVVERNDHAHDVLVRGVMLARHFGARLELFLCDAEPAYALRRSYDASGAEEARRQCLEAAMEYLESLRQSVVMQDIPISMSATCESPLYEGIVAKVSRSLPDLVIKCAGGSDTAFGATLDANDWQLVRTCPAPLLIVRGTPWHVRPRFAAAVDVSREESPGMPQSVLGVASFVARGCDGELDVLHASGAEVRSPAPGSPDARRALRILAGDFGVPPDRVRVISGTAEEVLPSFAASRGYDVIVLGALTRQPGPVSLVGALTGRFLDLLDSDLLLVKSGLYRNAHARRTSALI